MVLLEATHLRMQIQDRELFHIEHLTVQENDRIGLVGINGSGKTTLLHILAEKTTPKTGTVHVHTSCALLPQLKQADSYQSGGEITQQYIDHVLAKKPSLLLLDEPTTNLDTMHIESLEKQLSRFVGAFVIISHDRFFLDQLCTKIWELDGGKLTSYQGNYTQYREQKELELRQQETAFDTYVAKKKQLEEALILKEEKAKRATKKPKKISPSEARIKGAKPYFANKQKKLRQTAKAIETRLEKLDRPDKPAPPPTLKMDIIHADSLKGRNIMQLHQVTGRVPKRTLWTTRHIDIRSGDKIALIGPNGSGKTTLLKMLINQAPGISITPAAKIGYFSQNLDCLNEEKTVLENVTTTSNQSETIIRTVLSRLLFFGDDVHKHVAVLSGGERVKVAFAKILLSRINVLILDEPTNFLDIHSIEALEDLLIEYPGTLIFVSHDRRFTEKIAERIFHITEEKLHVFEGDYQSFLHRETTEPDAKEEQLLIIQTKLTEVISKLSLEPSDDLEEVYQQLLKEKQALERP